MRGWGRVIFLLGAGIFTAAGCGGRTSMLDEDSYDPDDGGSSTGNTGTGGTKPNAGRNPRGGKSSGGAVMGGRPNPGGGVSYGGYSVGASGGSRSFGGAPIGGSFPIGGAFPTGGFGGGPAVSCQACLFRTCNAELSQCLQDYGCFSIFTCAAATGCRGLDCYAPEACAEIIDVSGGLASPSMTMLLKSFSCVLTSGCPCN